MTVKPYTNLADLIERLQRFPTDSEIEHCEIKFLFGIGVDHFWKTHTAVTMKVEPQKATA